jgi:tetratricopeptide (TPR) repeat protein
MVRLDLSSCEMYSVVQKFRALSQSTAMSGLLLLFLFVQPRAFAATAQHNTQHPDHDRQASGMSHQFLSALKAYRAQDYPTAQRQLESLVKSTPNNFEVNELLGLVYVGEGKSQEANQFLAKAVKLRPNVAEARTALATNRLALHQADEAEIQFKKVAQLEPNSYDANHNLGEFYIQTGKIADAVPFLTRAQEIDPAAYNNGYDLALALEQTGHLAKARQRLQQLISERDSAELRGLLGEVEEKLRNYVSSAAQYEQAVHMEPSEENILNWGAELLLHQTFVAAIEVFKAGTERFPQSAQLHNGLGIAFYGAGQMNNAADAFFRASDLTPSDPLPLRFLGKACDGTSPDLATRIRSRIQSFINHGAQSAELNYYLAVCLWKGNQVDSSPELTSQIEALLNHAITLDPKYADAYFQLGNLYAEQRRYEDAIAQYERALGTSASSANIHYRLGQALARTGNGTRAQEEFAVFERLRKDESDATDKAQSQIQQFVYAIRKPDTNQQ